jgi:hypothetical protein
LQWLEKTALTYTRGCGFFQFFTAA